jgi:hypothetical protein
MPMPKLLVTFEAIEAGPEISHCCVCGVNPGTLKYSGARNGLCCLQCAFSMLSELAQRTVEHIKRAG